MSDMTPKETTYMGVRYRSRAEARFATCLMNSPLRNFKYEPGDFRLWTSEENGWVFDFAVWLPNADILAIEFKPAPASDEYMKLLSKRFEELNETWGAQCTFYLIWFDFFSQKKYKETCLLTERVSHHDFGVLKWICSDVWECKRHTINRSFFEPGINARFDLRHA